MQNVINFTNNKLNNWYSNAKLDYNVNGYASTTIQDNEIKIEYTEDGVTKNWSMAFYPEYVTDNGLDFFFNVWAEQAR